MNNEKRLWLQYFINAFVIFFSMKPNVNKRKEGRDSIEKIRRVIVFIFVPWVFDSSSHI
jgi:hypothetical protein